MQNYDTYPIMPDHRRALCPVRRGVITGIRPYARYQGQPLCSRYASARCHAGDLGTARAAAGRRRDLLDLDLTDTTSFDRLFEEFAAHVHH